MRLQIPPSASTDARRAAEYWLTEEGEKEETASSFERIAVTGKMVHSHALGETRLGGVSRPGGFSAPPLEICSQL